MFYSSIARQSRRDVSHADIIDTLMDRVSMGVSLGLGNPYNNPSSHKITATTKKNAAAITFGGYPLMKNSMQKMSTKLKP